MNEDNTEAMSIVTVKRHPTGARLLQYDQQTIRIPAEEQLEQSFLSTTGLRTHLITSREHRAVWVLYAVDEAGALSELACGTNPVRLVEEHLRDR